MSISSSEQEFEVLGADRTQLLDYLVSGNSIAAFAEVADANVSSSVSIVMMGCPTAQMVSFLKFISLTTPEAVEGILATSLSVNTSQRSSYYTHRDQGVRIYLFDSLADFNKDFLYGCFFCAFTEIRQLYLHKLTKLPEDELN